MLLDDVDYSHSIKPFIIMNYVRAHRTSVPLLLIDATLYCRLSTCSAGHSPLLLSYYACKSFAMQHRDNAECDPFQSRDLGSQPLRVVNLNCRVVHCFGDQHKMCVCVLPRPLHGTSRLLCFFLIFLHVALWQVSAAFHCHVILLTGVKDRSGV